jgi:NSS family neurotransmitter:Na+ symporter
VADQPTRSTFTSAWGAIAATAGVAIGVGNVWRFPYMMGQYGGSAFLVLYVAFVLAFGIPALMAEYTLGRSTGRGPWGAYQASGMPVAKIIAGLLLLTATMTSSYYAVIVAWTLREAVAGLTSPAMLDMSQLSSSVAEQIVYLAITIALGCGILILGVRAGIQRVSQIVIPVAAVLFVVLIVRSLTLPGAQEGLRTFLQPRWSEMTIETPFAALTQAVFSMGLGGMFMIVYGSYMRKDDDLPRTAVLTASADLAAALMAGLIVVPAALALSVNLESGPGLMFNVMPGVFDAMPAGTLFGAAFFASIFIMAILSLIAAYEVIVAMLSDALGWRRTKAIIGIGVLEFFLGIPVILFPSYLANSDLIWGSTMTTLGAALAVVAVTWSLGRAKALEELRANTKLAVPTWLFYWLKFVMPVVILSILAYKWIDALR